MTNRRFSYPADIREEDGEILVTFRDIPECITCGDNLADARLSAIDALDESISGFVARREPLPQPSAARRGETLVSPSLTIALKAALTEAMQAAGISGAELARRMDCDPAEVANRILSPRHNTKSARLEEALAAAGREVRIEIVDIPADKRPGKQTAGLADGQAAE